MTDMNNKINVYISKDNTATLKFPKCNIQTNAYIGENGTTTDKKEGDKKTPIGEFKLGLVMGTHSKQEILNKKIQYKQINNKMYWIDDSKSKYYNELIDISQTKKDWNSAEHLINYPVQYEYLIEIKTNPKNIPQKGSAIFLHCTNNNATAGCIAIDKNIMKQIIENIDQNTKIQINIK